VEDAVEREGELLVLALERIGVVAQVDQLPLAVIEQLVHLGKLFRERFLPAG
jgi:hypothetical protein